MGFATLERAEASNRFAERAGGGRYSRRSCTSEGLLDGSDAWRETCSLRCALTPDVVTTVTFQDTLWLFLAGITGAVGACAIPYGVAVIERLVRRRNATRLMVNAAAAQQEPRRR
jgi:hypothetical protein